MHGNARGVRAVHGGVSQRGDHCCRADKAGGCGGGGPGDRADRDRQGNHRHQGGCGRRCFGAARGRGRHRHGGPDGGVGVVGSRARVQEQHGRPADARCAADTKSPRDCCATCHRGSTEHKPPPHALNLLPAKTHGHRAAHQRHAAHGGVRSDGVGAGCARAGAARPCARRAGCAAAASSANDPSRAPSSSQASDRAHERDAAEEGGDCEGDGPGEPGRGNLISATCEAVTVALVVLRVGRGCKPRQ